MSQSIPYRLSQAVVAALTSSLPSAVVQDNPSGPPAPLSGGLTVWLEDRRDAPAKPTAGGAEGRAFTFLVGVISNQDQARATADAAMEQVKSIVNAAAVAACRDLQAERRMGAFSPPAEGERAYRVEGVDVDGAMVWTVFEITYRVQLPAR